MILQKILIMVLTEQELVAEFIDSNTNVLSSHRVSALNTVNKLQNEMYGPIISHRKVPKINLQFIYNFVNEGKFK